MKILVTGAKGFTGQHLFEAGRKQGHQMVAMKSDLSSRHQLQEEIDLCRPDAIIHLAAKSFVNDNDPAGFHRVNVAGTNNLLEAIKQCSVRPVCTLIASSANIYGDQNVSPIGETAAVNPLNEYAKSKVDMEKFVSAYENDVSVIITRPVNYTGCGQDPKFLIPKTIHHFRNKSESIELGNLDIEREFNDVRFVCQSYFGLLETGRIGSVYNICTGKPYSISSIIGRLQTMTKHQIDIIVNPEFVRRNDIQTLYGDPELLFSTVPNLKPIDIDETLEWMLNP